MKLMLNQITISHSFCGLLLLGVFSLGIHAQANGQDAPASSAQETAELDEETKARFAAFTEQMFKSVMIGTFTVDRDDSSQRRPERYEISKVVKLDRPNVWSFFARIKYGDHDVTVPVPVQVLWAGSTPVITVDNLTIPGMGTFDARVLIADNKYAGTWRHGEVGGLMFGRITKQDSEKEIETIPGNDAVEPESAGQQLSDE